MNKKKAHNNRGSRPLLRKCEFAVNSASIYKEKSTMKNAKVSNKNTKVSESRKNKIDDMAKDQAVRILETSKSSVSTVKTVANAIKMECHNKNEQRLALQLLWVRISNSLLEEFNVDSIGALKLSKGKNLYYSTNKMVSEVKVELGLRAKKKNSKKKPTTIEGFLDGISDLIEREENPVKPTIKEIKKAESVLAIMKDSLNK